MTIGSSSFFIGFLEISLLRLYSGIGGAFAITFCRDKKLGKKLKKDIDKT